MTMSNTELQEAIDTLHDSMEISGLTLSAMEGNDAAREALLSRSPITLGFPGDTETQAMGFALKYEEDMEDAGLSVEREYLGVTQEAAHPEASDRHAIRLHVEEGED